MSRNSVVSHAVIQNLVAGLMLVMAAISGPSGSAFAAEEPTVSIVDKAGFEKVLAQHRGKVVLVDCWATWCVPCVRDFPKNAAMVEALKGQGVVLVSLSFDDLDDNGKVPDRVTKFLAKQKGAGTHLISKLELSESGSEAFDIANEALPNLKIYDRQGKLLKTFASGDEEAKFTHEEIEKALQAAAKTK